MGVSDNGQRQCVCMCLFVLTVVVTLHYFVLTHTPRTLIKNALAYLINTTRRQFNRRMLQCLVDQHVVDRSTRLLEFSFIVQTMGGREGQKMGVTTVGFEFSSIGGVRPYTDIRISNSPAESIFMDQFHDPKIWFFPDQQCDTDLCKQVDQMKKVIPAFKDVAAKLDNSTPLPNASALIMFDYTMREDQANGTMIKRTAGLGFPSTYSGGYNSFVVMFLFAVGYLLPVEIDEMINGGWGYFSSSWNMFDLVFIFACVMVFVQDLVALRYVN